MSALEAALTAEADAAARERAAYREWLAGVTDADDPEMWKRADDRWSASRSDLREANGRVVAIVADLARSLQGGSDDG